MRQIGKAWSICSRVWTRFGKRLRCSAFSPTQRWMWRQYYTIVVLCTALQKLTQSTVVSFFYTQDHWIKKVTKARKIVDRIWTLQVKGAATLLRPRDEANLLLDPTDLPNFCLAFRRLPGAASLPSSIVNTTDYWSFLRRWEGWATQPHPKPRPITWTDRPGLSDFSRVTLKNIGRPGYDATPNLHTKLWKSRSEGPDSTALYILLMSMVMAVQCSLSRSGGWTVGPTCSMSLSETPDADLTDASNMALIWWWSLTPCTQRAWANRILLKDPCQQSSMSTTLAWPNVRYSCRRHRHR